MSPKNRSANVLKPMSVFETITAQKKPAEAGFRKCLSKKLPGEHFGIPHIQWKDEGLLVLTRKHYFLFIC
jgi:hypothetical protein